MSSSAGPPEPLIAELIDDLGAAFDLSTEVGGRTLGAAVEARIRSLSPAETPEWGREGDITQIAKRETGPLDFYYRPHLFPDMSPALRLGHELQFDLLPRALPDESPLRLAAVLESYCHLSGDLLGWRLEDDELFLWIADVSGHGIRAGLAAAVLYFLVDAFEPGQEPARLAESLNDEILQARNSADHRPLYATAFWLRFRADGTGVYASSGHPSMLLRRASGEVKELLSTGKPLGLLPHQRFGQVEFRLEPGESLCLFTDGLIESRDGEGREFGPEGVAEILRRDPSSLLDTAGAIYQAIQNHGGTDLLDDDLTFLVAGLK